jgi:hypothetical protein
MAISLSLATLPATSRTSRSVSSSIVATADSEEIISSISGVLLGRSEQVNIVATADDTLSISGTYADPFDDKFTFISKGSSDKKETPSIISGVSNVPANKDLFKVEQDTTEKRTKTYLITVQHDSEQTTFEITHDIENEFAGIYSFMSTYYD